MVSDYLFIEQLLIDRVTAVVPDLKAVLTASDLAAMEEAMQITPAAHVIYLGDETGTGPGEHFTSRYVDHE